MSNPNKAKGTRWETDLLRALRAYFARRHGLWPIKPRQEGRYDVGDLQLSPYVIQAKDWRSWESAIREGLDGAEAQRVNAGESYGVAIIKRARQKPGDAYAVQTVATWARVLLRLRRAEALLQAADLEAYAGHAEQTARDLAEPFPTGRET